ncbi:MAG: 5-oxoprolinase subunit PxpB [Bacteroidetes bacterium]|nr:5-oxoprolinase subunit PxpB [Bacteroidota bacterium]
MLNPKKNAPPYLLEYHPYSEYALLIQWPQIVSENILEDLSAFKKVLQNNYPDAILTAAYATILAVFPERITSFPFLKAQIKKDYELFSEEKIKEHLDPKGQSKKVKNTIKNIQSEKILYKIPVCYEASFAPDLDFVCDNLKLSPEALVSRHSNTTYTVYGIGFFPGFMYLGGLDAGLEISRKLSPRMKVPSGSVGLAAKQTGIYPCESPGGWQLIGQTPIPLFNPLQDPTFFAQVGDKIQFTPISKDAYKLLQIQVAAGIYKIEKTIYTKP